MSLEGRTLTVECPCAGTPHEAGDTIVFCNVLPLAAGIAGVRAMRDGIVLRAGQFDGVALAEHLFPVYLAHAIESWTFTDADGEPLPLDQGDAALPFPVKYEIADAADDLFGEEITRPLLAMIQKSSPSGQTAPSTSANRRSGRSRRSPSAPSSPDASADTEP